MADRFEIVNGRAFSHPSGSVSFAQATKLVSAAIAAAHEKKARDILVNTTALTGFASPQTFERFFAAVEWAARANGGLRLALVARVELIDPQKFGVTVAANRGLTADIFTSEAEAIGWLDAMMRPKAST